MASNISSLDAASNDRKAHLAKLASLKRKQLDASEAPTDSEAPSVVTSYLSGRNYDVATRGPRLGFDVAPTNGQVTLEDQAAVITEEAAESARAAEAAERPIDLFKLQPKKPNWDLKRDLDEKLKVLNVRTENAIARLVRERIDSARKAAEERRSSKSMNEATLAQSNGDSEGEDVGIDGETLVQGVHAREKEEEEEEEEEGKLREDDESPI